MRRLTKLPEGWIFLVGYLMIGLGFALFGALATAHLSPFLAIVALYFTVAFGLTVAKAVMVRSMTLGRLDVLVFEFLTALGFIILLLTY